MATTAQTHNHWAKPFYRDDANFRFDAKDGRDYCRTCGKWVQGRASEMRPQVKANRRRGITSKQYALRVAAKSRAKTVRASGKVATTEAAYLPSRTATGRRGAYPDPQERAGAQSTKRVRTKVGKTRRTASKPAKRYRPRHARHDDALTPGYGY
jgi:hypothetical protein